ncbi:MAG: universal stress protein [Anaerolineae bacterium]
MYILLFQHNEEEIAEACGRQARAIAADLEKAGVNVSLHLERGRLTAKIFQEVHEHPYDLIIIGSRGRRGISKLLYGSTALQVTEQVPLPVLVVKGQVRPSNKYLVCTSSGPISEQAVSFGGRLAKRMGAEIYLLHVISQVALNARGANLEELEASAETLMARGSREGLHLEAMLKHLKEEGVEARALVRHGLVVDEIIAEAREGNYEMIVVGSHRTPGVPPDMVDDVAGRILLAAKRPVLVVH